MLTDIIPSVALLGSGAYMLYKSHLEKETTNRTPANVEPNKVTTQEDVDNTTNYYNGRGDTDENGTIETDTKNDMYFGDGGNYDQFYDYTKSAYTKEVLQNSSAVASTMGLAMRCRIVSPFVAESEPLSLSMGDKAWAYKYDNYGTDRMKVGDSFVATRAFWQGSYREVAFVLEVFNPYSCSASLKQLVFKRIRIDNKKCQVVNNFGYCHDATGGDAMLINKKLYVSDSVADGSATIDEETPYILSCNINVPKQSSVFVPVVLPLAVVSSNKINTNSSTDKITTLQDNSVYVAKQASQLDFKIDKSNMSVLILNECECPKSLSVANMNMQIYISTSSDYTYNRNNGSENGTKNCSSSVVQLRHSYRASYQNDDDYLKSYIGSAEGKVPFKTTSAHHNDTREALAECIFTINDGFPLEDGFPKRVDLSYRNYEFSNDFTHDNLG